jgi:DNA-binding NarL/FixJ family response regulator
MAVTAQSELLSDQEWSQLKQQLDLSPRQADIVRHVLHGASDKQIAGALDISLPTVRTHMARLFRKLDLNDRVELIVRIFAHLRHQC